MKKGLIIIVALIVIAAVAYFLLFNNKGQAEQAGSQKQKAVPLGISKNPEPFNVAFGKMMDAYYTLKNDFVNWDSAKAGNDAATLKQLAQQVPYDTLQADKN